MATYLVTGGGGFIGSNLARALASQGEHVRVLDNFATGREQNLAGLEGKIDLIRGDIRDADTVLRAMNGADYVLHQAALPSVPRSIEKPVEANDVNVNGTLVLLEAARKTAIKRFVFAASSSAYGETPTLPKVETMAPDPLSPYATTKLAGESYLKVYFTCYGLETVSLRYFNVFGPHQDPQSQYAAVIPRFVTAALENRQPTIYGDGLQSRDFCHIENAIQANLLACTAPEAPGKVFNVACGVRTTLLDVLDRLTAIVGHKVTAIHEPSRPGDIKHSLADISRARDVLGYNAPVSFEEGLARTVDWYRKKAA
jgi:nucleoside-diphosphate-sugar epimerase